jgi:hypothetical protein
MASRPITLHMQNALLGVASLASKQTGTSVHSGYTCVIRPGRANQREGSTVITTLPIFCPVSTYR